MTPPQYIEYDPDGTAYSVGRRDGDQAARSRIVALLKDEDTADEVCVVLKEAVGTNERYKQIVKWTARALAEMIANAKE